MSTENDELLGSSGFGIDGDGKVDDIAFIPKRHKLATLAIVSFLVLALFSTNHPLSSVFLDSSTQGSKDRAVDLVPVPLPTSETHTGSTKFSYDPSDPHGPSNWNLVEIPNNDCGGFYQSGIDIPSSKCSVFDSYTFSPGDCSVGSLTFKLSDHNVQVDYPTDGSCTPPTMIVPSNDDDDAAAATPTTPQSKWQAVQFHFHSNSDHAIDGIRFGADFHLVHQEVGGGSRLAVLGMFLNPSSPTNTGAFDDILSGLESKDATTREKCSLRVPNPVGLPSSDHIFNPYSLLSASGYSIYSYEGSLTTPPCSEGVAWHIVDTPVSLSVRDYLRLMNLLLGYVDPTTCKPGVVASPAGSTSRPLHPLHGRTITRHCNNE